MIIIQDEKPLPGQVAVPFEKPLVDAVEALIRFHRSKGGGSKIETQGQWEVVMKVFEIWATLYPEDYRNFKKAQGIVKEHQKNTLASSSEKGGATIQHQLNIPPICYKLIKVLYPDQKYDKKFVSAFANRMPLLRMPDKL